MACKNPLGVFIFLLLAYFMTFKSSNAVKRFNIYEKRYIEDLCTSNETITYSLGAHGQNSSFNLGAVRRLYGLSLKNCSIVINAPQGYGIILRLRSVIFMSTLAMGRCSNYLEVYNENEKNYTRICRLKDFSSTTRGPMKLRYFTKDGKIRTSKDFSLTFTAFKIDKSDTTKDRFSCSSGEQIWEGFVCDATENCPDASDENNCVDISPYTIKPFPTIDIDWDIFYPTSDVATYRKSFNVTISTAIVSAVLIIIVGLLRFLCHYHCAVSHRRETLRRISIIRTRLYPMNSPSAPPPYTSLVNTNTMIPNLNDPPAYSIVVPNPSSTEISNSPNNEPCAANNAPKQVITEPPPPYEP